MQKTSLKEKLVYRFLINEKRVYKHWYSRFLFAGVNFDRIKRVISQTNSFYDWHRQWSKEAEKLQKQAKTQEAAGNFLTARTLFHEAAACFHFAEHIYFFDITVKERIQEKARTAYKRAINLYHNEEKPIRIQIPFKETNIPSYLRLSKKTYQPLIILINGGDNIKEVEQHALANTLLAANFNALAFDGPGQGEMRRTQKLIPNYHSAVSTIIDYFEQNTQYNIDTSKIATIGWSLGGYLSARAAAFDKRINCAVANGTFGYLNLKLVKKTIPIYFREMLYITGLDTIEEIEAKFGQIDIMQAPLLDRPLLLFQGGKDKIIRQPKQQADYIMKWATNEKELKYYPNGEHCCANYLDEVIPYTIDWLNKHLNKRT